MNRSEKEENKNTRGLTPGTDYVFNVIFSLGFSFLITAFVFAPIDFYLAAKGRFDDDGFL